MRTIANGMYGMILVEPAGGLPGVDREYYVMQGEFYTKGRTMTPGLQPFDPDKARDEPPDYGLFNGRMGALLEDAALTAKTGDTVRLYVGNGGPNLISSFHVIGEIFDRVYPEASVGGALKRNVQTTLIPAGVRRSWSSRSTCRGGSCWSTTASPARWTKGALGSLVVSGDAHPDIIRSLPPEIAGRHSGH